jgi:hypothetical protein
MFPVTGWMQLSLQLVIRRIRQEKGAAIPESCCRPGRIRAYLPEYLADASPIGIATAKSAGVFDSGVLPWGFRGVRFQAGSASA